MIHVIILLAFVLLFFFTLPPLSSPPSFSLSPHCVYLCNCVLHKGIRSALMRNCNCFFSLALWICSHVCACLWIFVRERQIENMAWMNVPCLMQNEYSIEIICFFSLSHIRGLGVKAGRSGRKLCYEIHFPTIMSQELILNNGNITSLGFSFSQIPNYWHLFISSVTKLFCSAEILIRYNSYQHNLRKYMSVLVQH